MVSEQSQTVLSRMRWYVSGFAVIIRDGKYVVPQTPGSTSDFN